MSYIVKGAELPKDCDYCRLLCAKRVLYKNRGTRPKDCPLEEVPTAHWIKIDERTGKCSNCGHLQMTNGYDQTKGTVILNAMYPYCPQCGAGREEKEETK